MFWREVKDWCPSGLQRQEVRRRIQVKDDPIIAMSYQATSYTAGRYFGEGTGFPSARAASNHNFLASKASRIYSFDVKHELSKKWLIFSIRTKDSGESQKSYLHIVTTLGMLSL